MKNRQHQTCKTSAVSGFPFPASFFGGSAALLAVIFALPLIGNRLSYLERYCHKHNAGSNRFYGIENITDIVLGQGLRPMTSPAESSDDFSLI